MVTESPNLPRYIGFFLGPLLFLAILFFVPDTFISPFASKTLALAAWMITWWVTEAASIPVTALLPLVLFPFLGVMTMSEAAVPYANPIIFLFLGGFMIALALEKHRLHERIALNLVRITGTSGNGIIMGFMIATAFISMWISNTATAMMMLPIALSVVNLLMKDKKMQIHELPRQERNFALGLMLMIGYAATLGGLATIIGTPPNVVFKGLLKASYGMDINFGDWMIVGVPTSIILCLFTYWMITRLLFPNNLQKIEGSDLLLEQKLKEIGKIRKEEKGVMIIFCLTSFCWIFQEALNTYLFKATVLDDTNVAMIGGIIMFLYPVDFKNKVFLLDWKDTAHLQWGILILFGGGLCLADGLKRAGIIQQIGQWIAEQSSFNVGLIAVLITVGVILSEFMSNVALVQIFVPVIFGISKSLDVNPILLALPVTFSASIGFMFPIATPPNAIVFSSGYIRMKDMVKAGVLLDIFSIVIILVVSITLMQWVFG